MSAAVAAQRLNQEQSNVRRREVDLPVRSMDEVWELAKAAMGSDENKEKEAT